MEEMQLREALNRSVRETHISQEGQSEKMISSVDGVMYSKKDMAIVRRILIDFNQDVEAVLALHKAYSYYDKNSKNTAKKKAARRKKKERRTRRSMKKLWKTKAKARSMRALLPKKDHQVRSRLAQSPHLQDNLLRAYF